MFRAEDAPQYRPAEIAMLCCWAVGAMDLYFIAWYYNRQNVKKAAARAASDYFPLPNQEYASTPCKSALADIPRWLDLTDRENTEFVYVL